MGKKFKPKFKPWHCTSCSVDRVDETAVFGSDVETPKSNKKEHLKIRNN